METVFDFTSDKAMDRVDWPPDVNEPDAQICKDGVQLVTIKLSSGIVYQGTAAQIYIKRKDDEVFYVAVQSAHYTHKEAVAEAKRVMHLLGASVAEVNGWDDRTRQLSPGAAPDFRETFDVKKDSYNVSILHSFEEVRPWFLDVTVLPFANDSGM